MYCKYKKSFKKKQSPCLVGRWRTYHDPSLILRFYMPFDGLWHTYINAHAALHEQRVFALLELCSGVRENEQNSYSVW